MAIPKFESLANTAVDILAGKLKIHVDWDTTNPQDLAIVLAQCIYQQLLHKNIFLSIRSTNKPYDVLRRHIYLWLNNIQRYTKEKHDVSPMASALLEYLAMHSMDVFDRAYPTNTLNPGFGFQQGIQDFVCKQHDTWRVAYLQARQMTYSPALASELNSMLLTYPKQWNNTFEEEYLRALVPKLRIHPMISSVEDMTIFETLPIWTPSDIIMGVWEHNIIKVEIEDADNIGSIANNALSMWYVANAFLYVNDNTVAQFHYKLDYRLPKNVDEGLAFFELHVQIIDDPYNTEKDFTDEQVKYAQVLAASISQYIVKHIQAWHAHDITRAKYNFAKRHIRYTVDNGVHGLGFIARDVIQSDLAIAIDQLNTKSLI